MNAIQQIFTQFDITTDLKEAPGVRQDLRAKLRQAQGPTFLHLANQYLERAQEIVRDNGHKRLVVILDGCDRLSRRKVADNISLEQQLFLDQSSQLQSIQGHVNLHHQLYASP